MAWQLLRVQTVYRCDLTIIALADLRSQCEISACNSYDFPAAENGQYPACGSNCLLWILQQKSSRSRQNKKPVYKMPLHQHDQATANAQLGWSGYDCDIVLHDAMACTTVSDALKFDWSCQALSLQPGNEAMFLDQLICCQQGRIWRRGAHSLQARRKQFVSATATGKGSAQRHVVLIHPHGVWKKIFHLHFSVVWAGSCSTFVLNALHCTANWQTIPLRCTRTGHSYQTID